MYKPLKPVSQGQSSQVSTMGQKGLNQEGLAEMMKLDYCKTNKNYIPYSYGIGLRKGLEKVAERVGVTDGTTLSEEFVNGEIIVGYGTKIESYNMITDTWTTIKDDFSPSTRWGGGRYGEYFFVTNGVDQPYRIDNTLSETIIAAAPICDDITFIGSRAVAVSLSSDETAVQVSEEDDTSNPPFDTWSTGTLATDGAIVNYRNAGKARCCIPFGNFFVVFSDDGYFAFYLNTVDSAGTLKKTEVIQDYITDFGGARGAITTPRGGFFNNEAGLWALQQVGQTDQPYSRQKTLISVLLSDKYYDNVDFGNIDMVYDEKQKLILTTYAKDSSVNNKILAYKDSEEVQAMFEIDGWNINRFFKYDGEVYGASSTDATIYKCFSGNDDDGEEIYGEYTQELPLGSLWNKHTLKGFYSKGFLSEDTEITINFDIYDRRGVPIYSTDKRLWTPQRNDNEVDGWGTASWGLSAFGGDFDLSSMTECFDGCRPMVRNAQRISVRFTSSNLEPHIINWFSGLVQEGAPIRIRKQSKIT